MQRYIDYVKSARPTSANAEILMPGEIEARRRAERMAGGVPLPPDTWQSIIDCARALGLPADAIPATT